MKKNKLFILLSIITLILIFTVAATCNLCGAPVTIGETAKTTEENSTNSSGSDKSSTEEGNSVSQDNGDTTETTEDISDENGVDADAEEGNIDENVEQGQDEVGDGEQDQVVIAIYEAVLSSEYSGSVPQSMKDGSYDNTDMQRLIVGEYDSQDWTSQAFLTFSHSQLSSENALITGATLFIDFIAFNGNTSRFNNISIGTVDWGDGAPGSYASEQAVNRVIDTYSSTLHDDISCSSIALQEEIQRLVDNNRLLQFKIYFTGGPLNNNDGSLEYIEYGKAGTNLVVNYIAQ